MKIKFIRVAALFACLSLLCVQSANAQRQREYQTANDAAELATASLASYNSFEATGDDGCGLSNCGSGCCGCDGFGGGNGLGLGQGLLNRPGQFFFGAEYIYARASFSEAFAYVLEGNAGGGSEFVEFDFDYDSSYRFYGGYQLCDCCAAITFDYARYRSGADFNVAEGATDVITPPYEVGTPGANNDSFIGSAGVEIDSYGIGISRTIPLGSPLCCGDCGCGDSCCGDSCCGDSCCGDSCGCGCWCPAWDITLSAGFRYADVSWDRGTQSTFTGTAVGADQSYATGLNFDGAGARVGLLGRRYIGRRGLASIYAKGDISLLVGDMDIVTLTDSDTSDATAPVISHQNSARRVIPVTEIEAGASAHIGNHITLTSGYFIAAWHDLGMRDTYDFGGQFQLSHYDDANILGFDGFFARAEVAF